MLIPGKWRDLQCEISQAYTPLSKSQTSFFDLRANFLIFFVLNTEDVEWDLDQAEEGSELSRNIW